MKINKSTTQMRFKLKGVGPQIAKHLARLEIFSVEDLLLHFPMRYQDRTQIQMIKNLAVNQEALIEGELIKLFTPLKGKTKLLCELKDATGVIRLRFFHAYPQHRTFKIGMRLRCFSYVRVGPSGYEMVHPELQILAQENLQATHTTLTPVYPATEGLSQYTLRKLTMNAIDCLQQEKIFPELIPTTILQTLNFPSLKDALQFIHHPPQSCDLSQLMNNKTKQQTRLIFEELLAHRLSLLNLKKIFQTQNGFPFQSAEKILQTFLQQLPFALTQAQQKVIHEIANDLQQSHPMLRLVQGDVGSGKTVVAAAAMLQAVANNYQAAIMAPTELLAEQHHRVMTKWFTPLNIHAVLLTGNVSAEARQKSLQAIANGEAKIIVGTHALFQEAVTFFQLALIVVDEQHRFGVQQRARLREKAATNSRYPHQLILSATPIPRTLAMSFYADLDASIIDELPPGRTPIVTSIIPNSKRTDVIARVREGCKNGKQVYWVCPLIEESESLNCQAASQAAQLLQSTLPDLKVGLIHGRMKSSEKETIMQAFQQGKLHILVATTVIEVGVDVANASIMIIENAERLGLSQLHQLRGRVGRGNIASHCILLYQHPLSELAQARLQTIRETTDGFEIAQRDLALRGPGEVLGTRQTGEISFRVADLMRDSELLNDVQQVAAQLMRDYPDAIEPLLARWLRDAQAFGKV